MEIMRITSKIPGRVKVVFWQNIDIQQVLGHRSIVQPQIPIKTRLTNGHSHIFFCVPTKSDFHTGKMYINCDWQGLTVAANMWSIVVNKFQNKHKYSAYNMRKQTDLHTRANQQTDKSRTNNPQTIRNEKSRAQKEKKTDRVHVDLVIVKDVYLRVCNQWDDACCRSLPVAASLFASFKQSPTNKLKQNLLKFYMHSIHTCRHLLAYLFM